METSGVIPRKAKFRFVTDAKSAREFLRFWERLAKDAIHPDLRNLASGFVATGEAFSGLADSDQVTVTMPRAGLGLFNAMRFLEIMMAKVPQCQDAVVARMSEALQRHRDAEPDVAARHVLSAAYECVVLMRFTLAGFEGEFMPPSKTGSETPDLKFSLAELLVECKDGQGLSGYAEDLPALAMWVRTQVAKAEAQLLAEDPERKFCHVICIDMPENVQSVLRTLEPEAVGQFIREALARADDLTVFDPIAVNVLFSSFDFNDQAPLEPGKETLESHESWMYPRVIGPIDHRMVDVYERLYPSVSPIQLGFEDFIAECRARAI